MWHSGRDPLARSTHGAVLPRLPAPMKVMKVLRNEKPTVLPIRFTSQLDDSIETMFGWGGGVKEEDPRRR